MVLGSNDSKNNLSQGHQPGGLNSEEQQSGASTIFGIYSGTAQLNRRESKEDSCRINQNLVRENPVSDSTSRESRRSLEYRPWLGRELILAGGLWCHGKSWCSSACQAVSWRSQQYQVQAPTAARLQIRYDSTVAVLSLGHRAPK